MKASISSPYNTPSEVARGSGGVLWFTGLSCAGKTTLARAVSAELETRGVPHDIIDGDEVRSFFEGDLGYDRPDREKNIRRIAFAAGLLARHGILTLVANIAPYDDVRKWIRARIPRFRLVFLDASLTVCRERDDKGTYASVNPVIGRDEPYEAPTDAELVIRTAQESVDEARRRVLADLEETGWISR